MLLSAILSVLFAFSTPVVEDAVSYWDSVLECYERLCDACMANRDAGRIANIREELDILLKEPVGKMNDQQQARFNDIRQRYSSVNAGSAEKGRIDTIVIIKQIPVEKIREVDHVVVYDTVKVQNSVSNIVVEHRYSRKDTTVVIHDLQNSKSPRTVTKVSREKQPWGWFVGGTASFYPDFSAGLTAGAGRKVGFYVKGRSNFKSIKADYSVDTSKDSFWGNGKSDVTRHMACAGGWFTIYKWLRMYAGVGYGQCCYYMQNTSGKWTEISNCSFRGVDGDLGLMFKFGRVTLFGGVNTTAFKYLDVEAGLAINIGG